MPRLNSENEKTFLKFLLSANHVALYAESDVVDKVGCHRTPGHKFRIRMIGPFLFHIPILSLFHCQNFFSLYFERTPITRNIREIETKAPREKKRKKNKYRKTDGKTDSMATQNYKNQLKGQNGTSFKKYWPSYGGRGIF